LALALALIGGASAANAEDGGDSTGGALDVEGVQSEREALDGEGAQSEREALDEEGAQSERGALDGEGAQSEREALDGEGAQSDVLNVVVPADIDFVIDPLEIAGRGQIYSDAQAIENRGAQDVLFTVMDARVVFANEAEFVPMPEPFDSALDDAEKKIYLALNLGGATSALTDAGAEIGPALISSLWSAGSRCPISVSGCVNPYSEAEWRDGDVKIQITYQMEAIPDEDAEAGEEEGIDANGDESLEAPGAPLDEGAAPEEEGQDPDGGGAAQSAPENGNGGAEGAGPAQNESPAGGEEAAAAPPEGEAASPDAEGTGKAEETKETTETTMETTETTEESRVENS
jgi:hypothetical protein